MERLLHSVTRVKEVLQSNLKLRQENMDYHKQVDQYKADMQHIVEENEELREKLLILAQFQSHDRPNPAESPLPLPLPMPCPRPTVLRFLRERPTCSRPTCVSE